jgi:P27 family predicted phage terminase small subunit
VVTVLGGPFALGPVKSKGVSMKKPNPPPLVAVTGGAGTPPEPPWAAIYADPLDIGVARETWRVIEELTRMQTLAVANGATIERLVRFSVTFTVAARDVAARGALVAAKKTGVPAVNPSWSIMKQASAAIRVLEAELGLSPAHRGRASKVKHEKKTTRPIDAYLKPVA